MTPNKEKALAALLTCSTRKEAAERVGISERTIRGYFQDDEFIERYRAAFADVIEEATRHAQQSLSPALSVLREIMGDEKEPASVRVQAAKCVIDYGLKLGEALDVLERVNELEKIAMRLEAKR